INQKRCGRFLLRPPAAFAVLALPPPGQRNNQQGSASLTIPNRFDLTGQTALVTGASSGLGRHFAGTLAAAGAKVALAARRVERLEEAVTQIEAGGGTAFPLALDVTDPQAIAPAFDRVEAALGPVTIL